MLKKATSTFGIYKREINWHLGYKTQLLDVVFAWEKRFPCNHFHEDATDRPDINGCSIFWTVEQQFRSSIPSCDDIFSHEVCFWRGSCKAKVTDFEVTVWIQKKVTWFQISVKNIRWVYIFQPPKELIQEILQK